MPYAFVYLPKDLSPDEALGQGIRLATANALTCADEGGQVVAESVKVYFRPTLTNVPILVRVEAMNFASRVANRRVRAAGLRAEIATVMPKGRMFHVWLVLVDAGWDMGFGERPAEV